MQRVNLTRSTSACLSVRSARVKVPPALARWLEGNQDTAVSVHGRTARQRYKNPADYDAIERIAAALARDTGAAVLGNGDVLTWREAEARAARAPHARALLVGRGALVKPWIFDELKARETWLPTAAERVSVGRQHHAW